MAEPRSEFRNDSPGFVGVVTLENGKPTGISVEPGVSVFLTEDEQILTANAPRDDADNPFINGTLTLVTKAAEIVNRRPIGDTTQRQVPQSPEQEAEAKARKAQIDEANAKRAESETRRAAIAQRQAQQPATPVDQTETGASVAPTGQPQRGSRPATEEVGTPQAPAKAG